jgi:hypothetical protein
MCNSGNIKLDVSTFINLIKNKISHNAWHSAKYKESIYHGINIKKVPNLTTIISIGIDFYIDESQIDSDNEYILENDNISESEFSFDNDKADKSDNIILLTFRKKVDDFTSL